MGVRLAAALVTTCLCGAAFAQTPAPNLTRQQRELLTAIVTAVDAAAAQPETNDFNWQHHIMRASDGSHYVAFSVEPPPTPLPPGPACCIVRLATASRRRQRDRRAIADPGVACRKPHRSTLAAAAAASRLARCRSWARLASTRAAQRRRPVTTISADGDGTRTRAAEQDDTTSSAARARRQGAVGTKHAAVRRLRFRSRSARADGTRIITRAFTAGPGDYDLFLAWARSGVIQAGCTVRVVRNRSPLSRRERLGLIIEQRDPRRQRRRSARHRTLPRSRRRIPTRSG